MASTPTSNTNAIAPGWSEPLNDFLIAVDTYEPTVPIEVVRFHMKRAGVSPDGDPRLAKIIALSADKFLAETIHEAKSTLEARTLHAPKVKFEGEKASIHLELEDLEHSYALQGIFQRRKLN